MILKRTIGGVVVVVEQFVFEKGNLISACCNVEGIGWDNVEKLTARRAMPECLFKMIFPFSVLNFTDHVRRLEEVLSLPEHI